MLKKLCFIRTVTDRPRRQNLKHFNNWPEKLYFYFSCTTTVSTSHHKINGSLLTHPQATAVYYFSSDNCFFISPQTITDSLDLPLFYYSSESGCFFYSPKQRLFLTHSQNNSYIQEMWQVSFGLVPKNYTNLILSTSISSSFRYL